MFNDTFKHGRAFAQNLFMNQLVQDADYSSASTEWAAVNVATFCSPRHLLQFDMSKFLISYNTKYICHLTVRFPLGGYMCRDNNGVLANGTNELVFTKMIAFHKKNWP